MNERNHSRREMLKQAGLGLGLAASTTLTAGTTHAAERSKIKSLMDTDVLVVGGGPSGIGAAIGAAKSGV